MQPIFKNRYYYSELTMKYRIDKLLNVLLHPNNIFSDIKKRTFLFSQLQTEFSSIPFGNKKCSVALLHSEL